MSASLVGSEMCIRDSPGAVPVQRRVHLRMVRGAVMNSLPSDATIGSSVSYTHLTLPTICSV
eukprot:5191237-Alexandrium_andersonii.AAC.1